MSLARCHLLGLAAVTSLLLTSARAVETGSSHYNTTDPSTAAWNYVGSVNGASGVFLGNFGGSGWVLTAGHVGAGSFTLDNSTYAVGASSFTNFTYNSQLADLTLFQIVGTPGLANLSLAALSTGNSVEMIGNGGGKSWGDNTVYGFTTYTLSGGSTGGPGIVTLASTNGGLGAQGVGGDSGGGMFYQSSGTWYLAGILSAAGPFTDGNGNNLGQGTVAVDLAVYYSQLNADLGSLSAIPEPATFTVIGGVVALTAGLWKRRKMRSA